MDGPREVELVEGGASDDDASLGPALAAAQRVAAAVTGRPDRPCGLPGAVCPVCPGRALHTRAGVSSCPRCGATWPAAAVEPCPWPAEQLLLDRSGSRRVCASHAAARHPSPLPAETDHG